jgi:hypothetical protein
MVSEAVDIVSHLYPQIKNPLPCFVPLLDLFLCHVFTRLCLGLSFCCSTSPCFVFFLPVVTYKLGFVLHLYVHTTQVYGHTLSVVYK